MPKKKATILLVEDDPAQTMMYEAELSSKGYNILTAKNEEEALAQVAKKPDLVFLDLLLGNSDGAQILAKIRKNPKTKSQKVVILSNFQKNSLKTKCMDLGALDFLVKSSLVPREIAEKVEDYI